MSARRAVIESTDGSGKSTAALEAAETLSKEYATSSISVVDSTGIYRYQAGELANHSWSNIENFEPHQAKSRLATAAKLGIFTVARRAAEGLASRTSDLVIGVRDPYRIDPATYSLVFGPAMINKLPSDTRLKLFNAFTLAPHPELIVHLQSRPEDAHLVAGQNGLLDSHETPENLRIIAEDLPMVLEGYKRLYGARLAEVEALQPNTSQEVAAQIEQLIQPSRTMVFMPELSEAA
jgi:thymidylate kinase